MLVAHLLLLQPSISCRCLSSVSYFPLRNKLKAPVTSQSLGKSIAKPNQPVVAMARVPAPFNAAAKYGC